MQHVHCLDNGRRWIAMFPIQLSVSLEAVSLPLELRSSLNWESKAITTEWRAFQICMSPGILGGTKKGRRLLTVAIGVTLVSAVRLIFQGEQFASKPSQRRPKVAESPSPNTNPTIGSHPNMNSIKGLLNPDSLMVYWLWRSVHICEPGSGKVPSSILGETILFSFFSKCWWKSGIFLIQVLRGICSYSNN